MGRWQRVRGRSRGRLVADLLVLGGLTGFVVLVYVVVVLGGGALVSHGPGPDTTLSVVATAVVALAFDRVQSALERLVARVLHHGQSSPYDALLAFSATVAGSHPSEELPGRMAEVLTDGTGAAWSQAWLVVDGLPLLAAAWPPGADGPAPRVDPGAASGRPVVTHDAAGTARRSLPVVHRGEVLGLLVVQERPDRPLSTVESRLFAGLADQAGPVLHGARLRARLVGQAAELSARAQELRTSRLRLVEAQDAGRRGLERDIHDGAQQHLVALAVNLRLAETLSHRSRERCDRLLAEQESAAGEAIDVLVALSRGIYPRALGADGLAAALTAAVATSPIPVVVAANGLGRYAAAVESAAYFCCLEAVQNAAKHSGAGVVRVDLEEREGVLTFLVEDDGVGFDPVSTPWGTGLSNLRDRIESADGVLSTDTRPGGGTRVRASLPARPREPAAVPTGARAPT